MIFPQETWERRTPEHLSKLNEAKAWLDDSAGDHPYRVVIIQDGRLIAEWNRGHDQEEQLDLASASKSIFSSVLGIVVAEGKLSSVDARIIDTYPEAFAIGPDEGPKPGRYAFEKDRAITFRQLISNTSGYMKPDEQPGKVFHYQTYGMNILTHALSRLYGLYDLNDPEGSPGFKVLVDRLIRDPIGASWGYYLRNFDLWDNAKINVFGYYDGVKSNALDMARLGWLWCNWGRWQDEQLIPEAWLREATKTAPAILENAPEEEWHYGYGFWTNDHGKLVRGLPRSGFMAAGAGNQYIWVDPETNTVIVQSPSPWDRREAMFGIFLERLFAALQ